MSLTAEAASAEGTSFWKVVEGVDSLAGNKRVAHVFTLAVRSNLKTRRKLGGQVLQAVHRKVNVSIKDRLLEFLRKQALALLTQLRQRNIQDPVAFGRDDFDNNLDLRMPEPDLVFDPIGLPESQLAAAGPYGYLLNQVYPQVIQSVTSFAARLLLRSYRDRVRRFASAG